MFSENFFFSNNNNEGDIPIALWKRIICFNIFDILIYLPYKIYEMIKTMRYIDKIFAYFGEKICYEFNLDKKNDYFAYLEEDYDLIFALKEKD